MLIKKKITLPQIMLILFISTILKLSLDSILIHPIDPKFQSYTKLIVFNFFFDICFILFLIKYQNQDINKVLTSKIPNLNIILISILTTIGCMFLCVGFAIIFQHFFKVPEHIKDFSILTISTPIGIITIIFIAPIIEEIIFRRIILENFLQQYTSIFSIISSGLIFGLYHLNFFQFFPSVILGIYLGYAYYKSKSVFLTIFLHSIFNLFVLFFNFTENKLNLNLLNNFTSLFFIILSGIILTSIGLIISNKIFSKYNYF